MRFQVPQNLDITDTIILGLGFKQMIYIGGALGLFIFILFFGGGIVPALIIGGPFALLAAILSFFTFNGQPFSVLLYAIIQFFTRKRMFVWKKEGDGMLTERHLQRDEPAPNPPNRSGSEKVKDLNVDLMFDDEDLLSDSDIEPTI